MNGCLHMSTSISIGTLVFNYVTNLIGNQSTLDMDEDYIDRHRPRKKTNRTNYQHYIYDCFNPIID
jgi:hypothetical protein